MKIVRNNNNALWFSSKIHNRKEYAMLSLNNDLRFAKPKSTVLANHLFNIYVYSNVFKVMSRRQRMYVVYVHEHDSMKIE